MRDEAAPTYAGGCLCGALRWQAQGEPLFAGLCYCADCRKASGSAFIPFLAFPAAALAFTGDPGRYRSRSIRGSDAVRNFCRACGGLVFGGEPGKDDSHTLYAGSLDDPALFNPTLAIFDRDRPAWALLPEGLAVFHTLPE
jgi:hypothetical protein